jgi:ribosome modulation factor
MSDCRTQEAERGYADYLAGKKFNECPFEGMQPEDITKRWNWQMGWLHAEKDKKP